jgi:glc operon protein GlcG
MISFGLLSAFPRGVGPLLTSFFEHRPHKDTTDTIVQLFKAHPSALITSCCRFNQNPHLGNVFEDKFVAFRRKIMSSTTAEIAIEAQLTSNPLDAIPNEIPFDVPYGPPISLEQAQAVIQAAVAEARKRNWKMNIAVADSGGNLVAFQRMDGAMLASIQIAQHKARAAVTFRRPTKVFEDGINLMHLNYLLAFDGIIASRGGIPLIARGVIDQGVIIGAIGCSGGTDSQDEVVSKTGAAIINQLSPRNS